MHIRSIKWLKKLENNKLGFDTYSKDVISVGPNRYQFMYSENVAKINMDEYQAELKIPSARADDAGMYICFVSDSSQTNAWSYKSIILNIDSSYTITDGQEKGGWR